jgi:hypothetical protein
MSESGSVAIQASCFALISIGRSRRIAPFPAQLRPTAIQVRDDPTRVNSIYTNSVGRSRRHEAFLVKLSL